ATADPNAPGSGRAGAREVVPPTRILDGFGVFGPPPANARPVPVGFTGRGTAENPPGFYGPPEGLLAVKAPARAGRAGAACDFRAQCTPGGLSNERTAGSARASNARGARAPRAGRPGRVLAGWRDCEAAQRRTPSARSGSDLAAHRAWRGALGPILRASAE